VNKPHHVQEKRNLLYRIPRNAALGTASLVLVAAIISTLSLTGLLNDNKELLNSNKAPTSSAASTPGDKFTIDKVRLAAFPVSNYCRADFTLTAYNTGTVNYSVLQAGSAKPPESGTLHFTGTRTQPDTKTVITRDIPLGSVVTYKYTGSDSAVGGTGTKCISPKVQK
jgi:hypothetical protein